MEIKEAIAILARIQEPEAWEPQITKEAWQALEMAKEAWQALEMAKEALVKESQGLAKDSVKDLPDTKVGNCSEIPNSSGKDTIYRQDAIDVVKRNTFRLTFAEEQNYKGHVAWSAEAVYSDVMEGALLELPSAQPETHEKRTETHSCDLIDRHDAIDWGSGT